MVCMGIGCALKHKHHVQPVQHGHSAPLIALHLQRKGLQGELATSRTGSFKIIVGLNRAVVELLQAIAPTSMDTPQCASPAETAYNRLRLLGQSKGGQRQAVDRCHARQLAK